MSTRLDYIDPRAITIGRDTRQRREIKDIDELAASIAANGLINPITIDAEARLIAGERRLTACLALGLNPIPVQYFENLSVEEAKTIELEENVKRAELSWQDRAAAIAEFHQLKKDAEPDWTVERTASALNTSDSTVSGNLLVHRMRDNPIVGQNTHFSAALNAAQRFKEREARSARATVTETITEIFEEPEPQVTETEAPASSILVADFNEWAPAYSGPRFNFLHCDFPYGVSVGDNRGYSAQKTMGGYEDSRDVYFELLETLTANMERLVDDSAHLIFWFSMDYYTDTKVALSAAGLDVNPFPLIWHKSDNRGILPDPKRGPRRTYETAFFASRGDRPVVQPVANSISSPTTKLIHPTEKPRAVLDHFFRLTVDETTRMLDPTAGSGTAIGAASDARAESVLGLELNPEFAAAANESLQ